MTEVRNLGGGAPLASLSTDTSAAAATTQTTTTSTVDVAKMLEEMARLAASLQSKAPGGTPGTTDANGAPAIDGVAIDFSPEDMAAALLVLQGKTQEAQLSTAREGLVTSKKKLDEKNQQAMAKINDWIKKCEDAAAKQKSAGIFGWISKIAGFVAAALAVTVAAVATVATGGAAAPLLALAIIGMVGATISLASQISQAAGGPALELSTLMSKLCTTVLQACGVPKEKAEAAGNMMSGMMGLMSGAVLVDPAFAGQAFGGFSELVGADANQVAIVTGVFTVVATIAISIALIAASGGSNVGSAIDGGAKIAITAGKVGQAAAGIAGGAAAATAGGLNIAKAGDERAASVAQADKKLIDAIIAKLAQKMEEDRDDIKKVMQEMMDGMNVVSQMIASAGQSRSQIASAMGGRQTI